MFRALHSRNYRLYFVGQLVSLAGTWMQMTAISWLVYRLTNSALMLGVIGFASIMFNAARLVGPSLAGMLIAVVGEGGCFFLNGVSFLAVITALLAMRIAPRAKQIGTSHAWQEMKEGAMYAFGFAPIRILLLLAALLSLVIQPFQTLMPVVAKEVLHGDASTLGFLMGIVGIGSLAGGLYMVQRRDMLGLEKRIALAVGALGVGLLTLALSRTLWLTLLLALMVGFAVVVQGAASNTLLQMIVEDDKRGRVMSFFTMAFLGMMPFGSLLGGALADRLSAPSTLLLAGCASIGAALFFTSQLTKWTAAVHPVYVRMGIAERPSVVAQTGLPADGRDANEKRLSS